MVLVGDSLAMVALGMNDTNAVTLDDMVLHCRSVTRAVRSAFVVSFASFLTVFSSLGLLRRVYVVTRPTCIQSD
jgi:ketopantoate hydroxymethyltransferase